jgi:hypothetical protein
MINELKICKKKMGNKLKMIEHQLSLLEKDEDDHKKLKKLFATISQVQDVCDKMITILYKMIEKG